MDVQSDWSYIEEDVWISGCAALIVCTKEMAMSPGPILKVDKRRCEYPHIQKYTSIVKHTFLERRYYV